MIPVKSIFFPTFVPIYISKFFLLLAFSYDGLIQVALAAFSVPVAGFFLLEKLAEEVGLYNLCSLFLRK